MNPTWVPVVATWYDLLASANRVDCTRFTAEITRGAHLELVGMTPDGYLLAVAPVTGQRYLIVRTGTRLRWGWATSVRIIPAVDTGDLAGRLVFLWDNGYPGHVNAKVYAS